MGEIDSFFWDLGDLPFVWSTLSSPDCESDIPNTLPFALTVDNATGVLTQLPSDAVKKALAFAYKKGAVIPGVMTDDGFGAKYANDFIEFIKKSLCHKSFVDLQNFGGRFVERACYFLN